MNWKNFNKQNYIPNRHNNIDYKRVLQHDNDFLNHDIMTKQYKPWPAAGRGVWYVVRRGDSVIGACPGHG